MNSRSLKWLMVGGVAYGALLAGVAQAQTADGAAAVEEVVVTGSRIARQDYAANSPIISVGQEAIQNTVDYAESIG